jgi:hypothetical protein
LIGDVIIGWLLASVDAARPHAVGPGVSWHGRLMVLAWGVLIPLGVVIARYFKVTARQDWPRQLDNRMWWHGHLTCQYAGGICMAAGFAIILAASGGGSFGLHGMMGYLVLAFGALQYIAGWLRGSKGGPTEAEVRGDHYDMTTRRIIFEHVHKTVGYCALAIAAATILTGLWTANAPRWMWLAIGGWWLMLLAVALGLQARGRHVSSYHAIWGPDPAHPGNRR